MIVTAIASTTVTMMIMKMTRNDGDGEGSGGTHPGVSVKRGEEVTPISREISRTLIAPPPLVTLYF